MTKLFVTKIINRHIISKPFKHNNLIKLEQKQNSYITIIHLPKFLLKTDGKYDN